MFPISRDPHKGGTAVRKTPIFLSRIPGFQFLGIPTKGELAEVISELGFTGAEFPISRDPPEGGT